MWQDVALWGCEIGDPTQGHFQVRIVCNQMWPERGGYLGVMVGVNPPPVVTFLGLLVWRMSWIRAFDSLMKAEECLLSLKLPMFSCRTREYWTRWLGSQYRRTHYSSAYPSAHLTLHSTTTSEWDIPFKAVRQKLQIRRGYDVFVTNVWIRQSRDTEGNKKIKPLVWKQSQLLRTGTAIENSSRKAKYSCTKH